MLAAVNLGNDTDTVAAIAGGLAGLVYGVQGIPDDWLNTLAQMETINRLTDEFIRSHSQVEV